MSSKTEKKHFTIAILGGGMCGLTCAAALSKAGIDFQIFEAAQKFGEIGAGVGMGPNCTRALKALGLFEHILSRTNESEPELGSFRYLSGFGDHEELYNYASHNRFESTFPIIRPIYIDAMAELLDPSVTHFGKRCIKVEPLDDSNRLHFTDGSTHQADLVIAADGIKSVARQTVTGREDLGDVAFSNTVAYRGLVPVESLKRSGLKTVIDAGPLVWMGWNRHIVTVPIKSKTLIHIVISVSNNDMPKGSVKVPQSEWVKNLSYPEHLGEFKEWGPDAQIILRSVKEPNKWSVHMVNPPLERFTSGQIALIGDAAHAMLPYLAAGFGQGVEDVLLLTRLLAHPQATKENLKDMLEAYDAIRRPRANFVLEGSNRACKANGSFSPITRDASKSIELVKDQWTPVWFHDLDSDFLKVKEILGWESG